MSCDCQHCEQAQARIERLEKLDQYIEGAPEAMESMRNDYAKMEEEKQRKMDFMKYIEIETRQDVQNEKDKETGKNLYTNAEAREAATFTKLQSNKDYQSTKEEVQRIASAQETLKTHLEVLKVRLKTAELRIKIVELEEL